MTWQIFAGLVLGFGLGLLAYPHMARLEHDIKWWLSGREWKEKHGIRT